jgi:cell fate (sporulation/competence/biofilm development) regulator YmcA (YheA/YmcA/DUF963 family)
MDPLTITACISGATKAYNLINKAVNAGREIEDTAQYIGKFFDSKEKLLELEKENQHGPKFMRGSSVEAQALEIQMAKHKTQQMEMRLREMINRVFALLDRIDADMKSIPMLYVAKDDYRDDIREVKEMLGAIFKRLETKADK